MPYFFVVVNSRVRRCLFFSMVPQFYTAPNILDISSETWQVVIDGKNVTICSIYDEDNNDFKATVKKDVFEKFIAAWLDFLRQDYSLEIIIDL